MTKDEQIMALRKILWSSHGHTGQYGDDGEMQCAMCFQEYGFWDWKRTPVDEIRQKIEYGNLRKFANNALHLTPSSPRPGQKPSGHK